MMSVIQPADNDAHPELIVRKSKQSKLSHTESNRAVSQEEGASRTSDIRVSHASHKRSPQGSKKSGTGSQGVSSEAKGNLSKYFRVETCKYNQIIYLNASILLRKFKHDALKSANKALPENVPSAVSEAISEDTEVSRTSVLEREKSKEMEKKVQPMPKGSFKIRYRNLKEKKLTFELALMTLKYCPIYEKILEEAGFFILYPEYVEEDQVVLIILNDYIKRKFQLRNITPEEVESFNTLAKEIELAIYAMRIKLNASVMRCRVKNGVRSLNQLLPEQYRQGEENAERMLVYMWYNANLATSDDMIKYLLDRGFKRVSAAKTLEQNEFYQDKHCADLYVFHHDDRDCLEESELVTKQRFSVVQDKSSCLAILCLIANIVQGEEIAIVNPTTLLTPIHVEGLLKNKFGTTIPLAPIRVFRYPKDDDDSKILSKMGSSSIKVHTEDILTLDSTNEKYRLIKHVLFQAKCTRSAVISPIDFLTTEQDDISLLKDFALRATLNGAKPLKISDCIVRNSMIIRQCLRFPSVRSLTYLTHSIYDEENEILINKAVDQINKVMMKDTLEPNGKYDLFSNIPPNLPLLVDILIENELLADKNVKFPPSADTNGFFISLFSKESRYMVNDDTEVVAQEEKLKKKKKK